MEQCPRMAACVMHWYSAVSRAALCLQENLTALYLLCREVYIDEHTTYDPRSRTTACAAIER